MPKTPSASDLTLFEALKVDLKSGAGFDSSSHPDANLDSDGDSDADDFLRPANDDFLTQLITAKPVVGSPVSMVNWCFGGHKVNF